MDKLATNLSDKLDLETTDNLAMEPIDIRESELSPESIHDPIALQILLEKEKQKCLKGLQSYYQKYGCVQIDILRAYLTQLPEDPEIQKQLDLLNDYS